MKSPMIILVIVIVVAVLGVGAFTLLQNSSKSDSMMKKDETVMQKDTQNSMEKTETPEQEAMEKKEGEEWERADKKPYEVREWKYYVFINPAAKKTSKVFLEDAEGCLSVPGRFGIVKRHEKMIMQAIDEHGKKFIRGASGFFARVMQHELDHLNGTLFIDKAVEMLKIEHSSDHASSQ